MNRLTIVLQRKKVPSIRHETKDGFSQRPFYNENDKIPLTKKSRRTWLVDSKGPLFTLEENAFGLCK